MGTPGLARRTTQSSVDSRIVASNTRLSQATNKLRKPGSQDLTGHKREKERGGANMFGAILTWVLFGLIVGVIAKSSCRVVTRRYRRDDRSWDCRRACGGLCGSTRWHLPCRSPSRFHHVGDRRGSCCSSPTASCGQPIPRGGPSPRRKGHRGQLSVRTAAISRGAQVRGSGRRAISQSRGKPRMRTGRETFGSDVPRSPARRAELIGP
jgi:hypothetical protein